MNKICQLKKQIASCEYALNQKVADYQLRHRQLQLQMENDANKIKNLLPIAAAITFFSTLLLTSSKRCRHALLANKKPIFSAILQSKKLFLSGKSLLKAFNLSS